MSNVITYVQEQLETLEQRPFCVIDSLALSFLAYISIPEQLEQARSWEGIRIADLFRAEHFNTYFAGIWAEKTGIPMLTALAASPRFRDITLHQYVERIDHETEMQFSASTFRLPDGSSYVAFKGTDSTLVGWKEDFNLSFQCPVPSQVQAVSYLNEAAARFDGPLYIGGHSKGGNLAIYSAAMCDISVQNRVMQVFSHDGPGFLEEFMQTPEYLRISGRVDKTIPQSSVIGMLMEQGCCTVVKSDAHGLMQHDPSSWLIEGCDFVRLEKLANNAEFTESTISQWMLSRTPEQRELFIDSLYAIVQETNAQRVGDLKADWKNSLVIVTKALADMDPETRSFAVKTLSDLVKIAAKNTPELLGVKELRSLVSISEISSKADLPGLADLPSLANLPSLAAIRSPRSTDEIPRR